MMLQVVGKEELEVEETEEKEMSTTTIIEKETLSIESTCSDSANPFPVVTEVHDPFGFSPSTSPQFVQVYFKFILLIY